MTTVALFGAAGKMGTRISERLREDPEYRMLYVEAGEGGQERLRQRGLVPTAPDEAARQAEVVILAIPDTLIGRVAAEIVPALSPGAMVICLDPAAPHGGELPSREDISYFVTHPCHPPIVNDEVEPAARRDLFGGIARQSIVCALMQGPEEDYLRGERIARRMFAPVLRAHRVTVEQMATLEPAMAETVILTCMVVIREAVDEAIRRGVPPEAARDFALGHVGVDIGILFGFIDARLSDGARLAVQRGLERLFRSDWRQVFEPENVLSEVKAITESRPR
ncbi:MAG: phosphogluconate dehydrogenase C-terminal domain-containing protein [Anaerolineae bacterium]|nr:phosphogluconate dehydrogenase C-terminal domain-containing protein [Anaerolineae bacterium]